MILDPQSELFLSSTCLQVLPDHVPLSLGSPQIIPNRPAKEHQPVQEAVEDHHRDADHGDAGAPAERA